MKTTTLELEEEQRMNVGEDPEAPTEISVKDIPPSDTRLEPSYDQIALRAYQIWEERGRPEGSAEEDWYRAEEELRGDRQPIV